MYSVVNAHVLSVFACMYVVLYFIVQFDVQTRRTHTHTHTHTQVALVAAIWTGSSDKRRKCGEGSG